jgi:prepilin-type N-terminal cleavage/methylation domain-containing protein
VLADTCGYVDEVEPGVDLPATGTKSTSDFSLGVSSAVMGGLFGDAGAIGLATMLRGRGGRGPRGFTLLELLITLSVTTIGLVGLLALHQSVVRGNDGASRSAEAQQIGAATLEALRAQRLTEMMLTLTGSTTVVLPTPAYVTTATGRGGVTYTVTTTVVALAAASPSLIRIRVVTSWTEDGGGAGGQLGHALPLEVVRTLEEAL